ncbi:hypothetical protein SAMN05216490_5069 [Mucilaginibacter mallensis]|uniref:Uncharacterized protein n=1 Tax=Mucilaginibacter mallensis TaxID=652787 RepID=A0A1H2CHT7_MUCMA|nr:hypothetical protein [Mucilaginibacter mallensis]SDT69817.1 hypothetical protein SAMN05216490_5069 [Mucilaginibacter mallensis]
MKQEVISMNRPLLKSRGLSTHHIEIFEFILSGKSNREINQMLGYSKKSHVVVDHSRKVMYKLLAMEDLCRKEHIGEVVFPRGYCFWWKGLLLKHQQQLMEIAIKPEYYVNALNDII